eukprot:GILK01002927.1.p1 GENE.GILK01002927.1~~GILK01002927.1.p1  ORF type:complete len:421 (-),score=78.01 GILK01002927.1:144-1355(-)
MTSLAPQQGQQDVDDGMSQQNGPQQTNMGPPIPMPMPMPMAMSMNMPMMMPPPGLVGVPALPLPGVPPMTAPMDGEMKSEIKPPKKAFSRTSVTSRVNFSKLNPDEQVVRYKNLAKEVKVLKRKIKRMQERLEKQESEEERQYLTPEFKEYLIEAMKKLRECTTFELDDQRFFFENAAEAIATDVFPIDSLMFDVICSQFRPYMLASQNTSGLGYTSREKKFWARLKSVKGAGAIRLVSGPKHGGQLKRGQNARGHFEVTEAEVSMWVPSLETLRKVLKEDTNRQQQQAAQQQAQQNVMHQEQHHPQQHPTHAHQVLPHPVHQVHPQAHQVHQHQQHQQHQQVHQQHPQHLGPHNVAHLQAAAAAMIARNMQISRQPALPDVGQRMDQDGRVPTSSPFDHPQQ